MSSAEVAKLIGISKATLYRRMREGGFPRPLKFSSNLNRWDRAEIDAYLDRLPRGGGRRAAP